MPVPAQSPIPPGVTVHDVNNKIGIILTRCDLLETHSTLGVRAAADLRAIREAAEALAVLVHGGLEQEGIATRRGIMDSWLAVGIFLLGTGIGALLTRIADHGRRARRFGRVGNR